MALDGNHTAGSGGHVDDHNLIDAALAPMRLVRSGKDANGIFTTVQYFRVGGNLANSSVLSGGTSPQYTTRTFLEYDLDGITVVRTTVYTLSYDIDGALTSEAVS
jgi:hypothetical protein